MSFLARIPPPTDASLLPHPFAYVVTYELKGPPVLYQDLFTYLRASDAWCHWVRDTWLVLRREPLVTLANDLRGKINQGDWLMVMPAKGPVDGWLPKEAWEWIHQHLPREW
jgi:hypothetical protein